MGQDEDGSVIRRLRSPPPFPAVIGPGSADGTEHVAAEDPGTDSVQTLRRDFIVDPRFAAFVAMHPLPGPGMEKPLHQAGPADAERMLQILMRSGAVAIE